MSVDLIARLERATGPDRAIDVRIALATGVGSFSKVFCVREFTDEDIERWVGYATPWERTAESGETFMQPPNIGIPEFTSSIDAARALVPEGYGYIIVQSWRRVGGTSADVTYEGADAGDWRDPRNGRATHKVPAIALVLAALRARATQEK